MDLLDKNQLVICPALDIIHCLFHINRIIALSIALVCLCPLMEDCGSHKYAVIVPSECAFAFVVL